MDVKNVGGVWTEEEHSAFLNRIEQSFVQRMQRRRRVHVSDGGGGGEFGLRLDRVLPDSATESNRDHLETKKRSMSLGSSSSGAKKRERERKTDDISFGVELERDSEVEESKFGCMAAR